jgi:hypothetical protein
MNSFSSPLSRRPLLVGVWAVACLAETCASQQGAPPAPANELADLRARVAALEARDRERPALAPEAARPGDYAPTLVPFAWGDFRWMPGNYAPAETPLRFGAFTGEVRADTTYHWSFANPSDNTIAGSSEVFRHGELQVTQLGFGGDVYYRGAHARVMTQFGMYSQTTPRNDASPARGQWNLDDAYRYLSEAYAGYHIDALHGINVQAGIFMSYIGLWSYYNFDNWTYQPSYVSSNTPWFFEGVRAQIFTSDRLKIEPWVVNGWQSYGEFRDAPGVGLQVRWVPEESFAIVSNQYAGKDTLGVDRVRLHSDNSAMLRYLHAPGSFVSKAAVSLTLDAGCETGEGVTWDEQYFLGFMAYHRLWFAEDRFALTIGGGAIENPGRYLVLVPPVNGATAASGTPYFSASPGDSFHAWDAQVAFDYMPTPNVSFRLEYVHRHANVPYFTGSGGMTPAGGNTGDPTTLVPGFDPDLDRDEDRITLAFMVRF